MKTIFSIILIFSMSVVNAQTKEKFQGSVKSVKTYSYLTKGSSSKLKKVKIVSKEFDTYETYYKNQTKEMVILNDNIPDDSNYISLKDFIKYDENGRVILQFYVNPMTKEDMKQNDWDFNQKKAYQYHRYEYSNNKGSHFHYTTELGEHLDESYTFSGKLLFKLEKYDHKSKGTILTSITEYNYNDNGDVTEERIHDEKDNELGKLSMGYSYYENKNMWRRVVNGSGKLKTRIDEAFYENGQLMSSEVMELNEKEEFIKGKESLFKYDSKGMLIEETSNDVKVLEFSKKLNEENKEVITSRTSSSLIFRNTFEYVYDEKGNWIIKYTIDSEKNVIKMEKRYLVYFD